MSMFYYRVPTLGFAWGTAPARAAAKVPTLSRFAIAL